MKRTLVGDQASRLATDIIRERHTYFAAVEDVRAFNAPSECMTLVSRSACRRMTEMYRMWRRRTRMNQRQLERALRSRVSEKCAYNLGI